MYRTIPLMSQRAIKGISLYVYSSVEVAII